MGCGCSVSTLLRKAMFRHSLLGRAPYKLKPASLPAENEGEEQLDASAPSQHLALNPEKYQQLENKSLKHHSSVPQIKSTHKDCCAQRAQARDTELMAGIHPTSPLTPTSPAQQLGHPAGKLIP